MLGDDLVAICKRAISNFVLAAFGGFAAIFDLHVLAANGNRTREQLHLLARKGELIVAGNVFADAVFDNDILDGDDRVIFVDVVIVVIETGDLIPRGHIHRDFWLFAIGQLIADDGKGAFLFRDGESLVLAVIGSAERVFAAGPYFIRSGIARWNFGPSVATDFAVFIMDITHDGVATEMVFFAIGEIHVGV